MQRVSHFIASERKRRGKARQQLPGLFSSSRHVRYPMQRISSSLLSLRTLAKISLQFLKKKEKKKKKTKTRKVLVESYRRTEARPESSAKSFEKRDIRRPSILRQDSRAGLSASFPSPAGSKQGDYGRPRSARPRTGRRSERLTDDD